MQQKKRKGKDMRKIGLRLIAVLLVLTLLSALFVPVYSAEGAPATYSTQYNSGERGVVCTTLSGTSAALYYQNYDYDTLSELSQSQLFTQLQSLMKSTHEYIATYHDCHYKADRVDCTNGSGNVSLIYTAYSATMDQWNGWNREHIWPQSLGGGNTRGGGADLHHVRPSDAGVNSSRGNKKYGESGSNPLQKMGTNPAVDVLGGTYNGTYFEPLDSVKGDVARICLYVYVRWNSQWGADSITDVFQSVDVLLEWCELDPVDTWEMGRNEVVGDIQGNRNVFIDYPEYAWLIFGREVPADMTTPSGKASTTSTPDVTPPETPTPGTTPSDDADCTHSFGEWEDIGSGMKTRTCSQCGISEVSTKNHDDAASILGCDSAIENMPAVIISVAVVGFALTLMTRGKKRKR